MVRIDEAPRPEVRSRRKVGLEIEIDIGHNGDRSKIEVEIPGWTKQHDGSLFNGFEFVFDGSVMLDTAEDRIKDFCTKIRDVNVKSSGGFHVHVQGIDYTHADCYHLALLYSKFQQVINKLVGPSRVHNHFCEERPQRQFGSLAQFVSSCRLDVVSSSRSQAKNVSERYWVVNLNMMTCSNEDQRSIEFRQGSVSKRAGVVFGWTSFLVAMTEAAKNHAAVSDLPRSCSLAQVIGFLKAYEESSGSKFVADWVKWRHDYINQNPDEELLKKAKEAVFQKPIGLYGLSRILDVNLVVCQRVFRQLVSDGIAVKHPTRPVYMVKYENKAKEDMESMIAFLKARKIESESAANLTTAD